MMLLISKRFSDETLNMFLQNFPAVISHRLKLPKNCFLIEIVPKDITIINNTMMSLVDNQG